MNAAHTPGSILSGGAGTPQTPTIVIQQPGSGRRWVQRLLLAALIISVLFNLSLWSQYRDYFSPDVSVQEKFHSGDKFAADKISIIEVNGTIMPPFTDRILQQIKRAQNDDAVKGVVLSVDSPGGLVADSHRIYHKLKQLSQEKPIVVAMQQMAASGGYYVSMGAGPDAKIFAEPTAWTGSIGVIIPRFDITKLAEKIGVESNPLKTGEFKDTLSPFRKMTDQEQAVWTDILNDAFDRFLSVVADNRKQLDVPAVRKLATGQVYTADQAKANGLIDEIGYEEDAVAALKKQLGLEKVRVVRYKTEPLLLELLTGSASSRRDASVWKTLLEATVPRAMYYCSWAPTLPAD